MGLFQDILEGIKVFLIVGIVHVPLHMVADILKEALFLNIVDAQEIGAIAAYSRGDDVKHSTSVPELVFLEPLKGILSILEFRSVKYKVDQFRRRNAGLEHSLHFAVDTILQKRKHRKVSNQVVNVQEKKQKNKEAFHCWDENSKEAIGS